MRVTPQGSVSEAQAGEDPYLWLEEIASERALAWVREQNAATMRELGSSAGFEALCERLLGIFNSQERIPDVHKHGAYFYNFWRDGAHVRGLWRRTTFEEYKKPEPAWETMLDLDELARAENENWVWKGVDILRPTHDRALTFLSRGGADATVVREFDVGQKEFVRGGFFLPEAKTDVAWRSRDALYVGTDFGPGSLTRSGYPRIIKEWRRHDALTDAPIMLAGERGDVGVGAEVAHDHGRVYEFIRRRMTFFTNEVYVRRGDLWIRIDKPNDARVQTFGDRILLRLRSDWTAGGRTYPAGALLAADFEAYLKGDRDLSVLFEPSERKCLSATSATKNYLIINELDNVRNRLYLLRHRAGQWTREILPAPALGSIH
ncbi:MAG TPA: hypothetical protein VE131_04185, partial [Terriglobales bacterium]|nr:hypothetical protein [Terriglobales bacterium]